MLSARRSRKPEGASNINSARNSSSQPNTGRSDGSTQSISEVLRQMTEKNNAPKILAAQKEIEAMGPYNSFSRPKPSTKIPLRSVFLDPSVNNFAPSKTRSELMKKIYLRSAPHPSYDLDNDGYVSQEDYRLAKRFDFDGNGVLDPEERLIGKRVLAHEFFKKHSHHLDLFGPSFAAATHKQNVHNLAASNSFERSFEKLKSVERTLEATSAKTIQECICLPDDTLTRHNYYCNRFDTTAWNDFDAIPRSASQWGDAHGGSRKRLLFTRRQNTIDGNQAKLDIADAKKPQVNTRRLAIITNVGIENN